MVFLSPNITAKNDVQAFVSSTCLIMSANNGSEACGPLYPSIGTNIPWGLFPADVERKPRPWWVMSCWDVANAFPSMHRQQLDQVTDTCSDAQC
eukprot:5914075-Heterocapsa_arctica.AAC.1